MLESLVMIIIFCHPFADDDDEEEEYEEEHNDPDYRG